MSRTTTPESSRQDSTIAGTEPRGTGTVDDPAPRPRTWLGAQTFSAGFVAKLVLVGLVDALGLYGILASAAQQQWGVLAFLVAALLVVNLVYFSRRAVPAKYLVPGLIFLLVYQVFVVAYTGWTAFTNYGDGHNSTRADAVEAVLVQDEARVTDSPTYPLSVLDAGGEIAFAVVDPADGDVLVGAAEQPLAPADGARVDAGRVTAVDGYEVLGFAQVVERQADVFALRVPMSDDPNDGSLRTTDGSAGYVYASSKVYDEAAGTITDTTTGTVYTADESTGSFRAPDGSELGTGWRVFVGFENFTRVLGDAALRGPFLGVLVWTFVFAIVSVALTFGLGLFLAIVLNDWRMKGRTVYRSLLILPYAFPAFLSALVWQGMLNRDYGFVNQTLLGGAEIPWLTDPVLAKIAVLTVNLWLGFPYMFLICTGALQSVPHEVYEAGRLDGARPWRMFRSLTMPLLLVSTAPLLISSFAFNFNNFNVIYLTTEGGPKNLSAPVDVGATDILITFVYKIAFGGVNRQYGLACAISILIFLIVATISAISFRRTRALEELN